MNLSLTVLSLVLITIVGCSPTNQATGTSPCNDALVERVKATSDLGSLIKLSEKLVQQSYGDMLLENMKWVASDRGADKCTVAQVFEVNGQLTTGAAFYIDLGKQRIYTNNKFSRDIYPYGNVKEADGGGVSPSK